MHIGSAKQLDICSTHCNRKGTWQKTLIVQPNQIDVFRGQSSEISDLIDSAMTTYKIKCNDFIDTDHKEYNYRLTSEDKLIEELSLNFWTENNAIQAVSEKYLQSIEPLHAVINPNSYKWHSQIHHSVSAT